MVKKFFWSKIFGPYKNLCPNKCLIHKKNLVEKNSGSKEIFFFKKILGPRNFVSKKCCAKEFRPKKNFGSKNFFFSKISFRKILCPKILGWSKFCAPKNVGSKKLSVPNFLDIPLARVGGGGLEGQLEYRVITYMVPIKFACP